MRQGQRAQLRFEFVGLHLDLKGFSAHILFLALELQSVAHLTELVYVLLLARDRPERL